MSKPSVAYFVGVDVGTGSVRAALVTEHGKIISTSTENTKTWNIRPDFFEQSTEDIWNAVVKCVKVMTLIVYLPVFHDNIDSRFRDCNLYKKHEEH